MAMLFIATVLPMSAQITSSLITILQKELPILISVKLTKALKYLAQTQQYTLQMEK